MAAGLSLLAPIASSVWRTRLRHSSERWHRAHTVPAVVVVVTALVHIHVVDERVSSLVKQVPWGLMTAAFVALGAWARSSRRRSPSSSRASRSTSTAPTASSRSTSPRATASA
ncbi:MAG TPA: hypothetical protein VN615_15705 [Gaiellales bacterium]|nr:hypothetical protein [Gaiellales bacterium]